MPELKPDFSEWCFKPEDMHRLMPSGDEFASVIRGHLFVENVLIHFLTEALPHPELLQIDRLSFNLKVELCAALGALPKSLIAPMQKINALRNKAAHDLEYKVSVQDKLALLDSYDANAQELALLDDKEHVVAREEVDLARLIKVAAVLAEVFRHKFISMKEERTKAILNARHVLERTKS